MPASKSTVGLLLPTLLVCCAAWAQPQDPRNISDDEIEQLVEKLDSDRFAERTEAARKLLAAGASVVEPLAKAAESGSFEARFRALKILADIYRSENGPTHEAGKRVLEQLRQSKNRSTAQRAAAILEEPTYELPAGNWLGEGAVRGIRGRLVIGGGQGVQVAGGVFRVGVGSQVTVTEIEDGTRLVDVIQGSGRGILILDGEKRGAIEIHVREPQKDGKAKFQRYVVKDAEELARKHPDIDKLYQKFRGLQENGVALTSGNG